MEPITETKNIPGERWQEFRETYTTRNRGRAVSITIVSEDAGELLAKGVVFSAIDYAPVGKDDDFVMSYGDQASLTRHIVYVPVELWQAQDGR
jgi:hypothetical protein